VVTFPDHVAKALTNHDRRLRPAWNPKQRRWEILYLRTGYENHSMRVYHPVTARRHFKYALVHTCAGKPSWRDYETLRGKDTVNVRMKDELNTFVNEAARAETKQKQDFSDQLGTDLDDRITTQRMSTGWRAPSGV